MDPQIAVQGHAVFSYLATDCPKLMKLPLGLVGTKLRKIQLPLPIIDMVLHPPGYWLNRKIPGIGRVVTVAIVTRALEHAEDVVWHREGGCQVACRSSSSYIFLRPEKLNDDQ